MVIFDIETIPRVKLSEKLLLFRQKDLDYKDLKVGNLKDPEKILAKQQEIYNHNEELKRTFRSDDAKDIDYAQPILIGCKYDIKDEGGDWYTKTEIIEGGQEDGSTITEAEMVEDFMNIIDSTQPPYVGFNILGYDIPILKRSCIINGIKFSQALRYKENIVDLYQVLKDVFQYQPKKLIVYAMLFGFDVDLEIADARKIFEWYADGNENLYKHLNQDLELTERIYYQLREASIL